MGTFSSCFQYNKIKINYALRKTKLFQLCMKMHILALIFQMQKQLKKALHDLQEEKEMNKCLLENQSVWQQKVTGLEIQIRELAQMKEKV